VVWTICCTYGLKLITRNPLFPLAFRQPPSWWLFVESLIEFGSIIPALLLFQDLYGKGWRSSLTWLIRIYSLFAIIGFAVSVYKERPGLLPAPGLGIIILLPLVLLFGRVMGYSAPKFPHRALLFAALILYFLAFVHDRLINAAASVWRPGFGPYGFFVLVCTLGYVVVQRVLTNEKQLSALSEEMHTAKQIQSSILPGSVPNVEGLDIAVQYAPLSAVAGDFYDSLSTECHCLGILLADVTGHGVPAALVASTIKVAVSTQLSNAAAPSKVLAGINSILCRQAPGQYATAVYCYYDQRLRVLRYSAAGHPPPLLWQDRTRRLLPLEEGGLLIGVRSDEVYPQAEISTHGRDRLLLYTDGVPEAINSARQSFGEFQLVSTIEANAHLSAQRFSEVLLEEVRAWSRSASQVKRSDDITFLVIDFHD
jgi:phosphoserine phosphatase RsbU/P